MGRGRVSAGGRAGGHEFDLGLLGQHCWLELATGERIELAVERWASPPGETDLLLMELCTGPTLDVGCGPGRLASALAERGIVALGVDSSRTAVRLTLERGGTALHRDVFGPLPGEGRWQHVLLADGNIGIGGDPVALLRRVARLVAPGGTALVEIDPPGQGLRRARARLRGNDDRGEPGWFAWAWLGADAVGDVAAPAGLEVTWVAPLGGRWFTELTRP
jgi:SAM-dependent methyltransferase